MVSYIEGTIIETGARSVVLKVGGIGYKIFTTQDTITETGNKSQSIGFWTHFAVREDSQSLYGFLTKEDRDFFELLITVPGIGPKSALAVLNVVPVKTLVAAIAKNDSSYLVKVSGIGKKTADKIVLTLKDKVEHTGDSGEITPDGDVHEALKSLGYGDREIREVLRTVPERADTTSNKIKEALKLLGKK